MITQNLLFWYLRELNKLKEEILLYKNEADLWIIKGDIKNSSGTLAVHLTGSLKHFIGAQLGNTGYVRERDKEFSDRNIPREKILDGIDEVIAIVQKVIPSISDERFSSEYPIEFIGQKRLVGEILFIMYGHINYHLGQINYHRRLDV